MMQRNLKSRNRDAGSALVEWALSSVTVLTLLFGTVDLGRALYAYDWVANAARLGTRFAMVRGTKCTGLSGGCPAQPSDITTYIDSNATGIDTSQLTITSACFAPGSTTPGSWPCDPQYNVKVTVQYNFKFLSPLFFQSWTMQSWSERIVQN
jgi:Flp pilus assembly protein TadG